MDPRNPISILLIEGGRVRQDSDAVLRIYEVLGFPWLAGRCRVEQAMRPFGMVGSASA